MRICVARGIASRPGDVEMVSGGVIMPIKTCSSLEENTQKRNFILKNMKYLSEL